LQNDSELIAGKGIADKFKIDRLLKINPGLQRNLPEFFAPRALWRVWIAAS
jgi:hypothetical protein